MLIFVVYLTIFRVIQHIKPFFNLYLKKQNYIFCNSLAGIHRKMTSPLFLYFLATSLLQMHHYISKPAKFFFCAVELWKQTIIFAIKQSCSFFCFFLCFCIFFLVKHIVNLNNNQIMKTIRFITVLKHTCKKIYIVNRLIPFVFFTSCNLHKTKNKKNYRGSSKKECLLCAIAKGVLMLRVYFNGIIAIHYLFVKDVSHRALCSIETTLKPHYSHICDALHDLVLE